MLIEAVYFAGQSVSSIRNWPWAGDDEGSSPRRRAVQSQTNLAFDDVAQKTSPIDRVVFNGNSAEIVLAHVLAQCDQPVFNPVLFRNGTSRGGGLLVG